MATRLLDRFATAVWYGRTMLPYSRLTVAVVALALGPLSACSAALNFDALSASRERDAGPQDATDAAAPARPEAGTSGRGGSGSGVSGRSGGGAGGSRAGAGGAGASVAGRRAEGGGGGTRSAAGVGGVAVGDADDAGVLPGNTFCATQGQGAILCDDFEGPALADVWSYVIERPVGVAAGSVQSDSADAVSPTRSLLTVVREGLDPAASDLALGVGKDLSTILDEPSRVELDFDMKLEQFDSRVDLSLIAMQVTFGLFRDGWYGQLLLSLQNSATGPTLVFAQSDVPVVDGVEMRNETKTPPQAFAAGEWVHVHFAVDCSDREADKRKALVRVAERVLYEGDLAYRPRKLGPNLELGAPWVDHTGGSQAWRLRYDNVVLRAAPL